MREDLLGNIARSFVPQIPLDRKRGVSSKKLKVVKSGTTIVALQYREGVVMAADRRTSWGRRIISQDTLKIESVATYTGVGCAGLVSDGQYIKSLLRQLNKTFYLKSGGIPLTVNGQANYIVDLLHTAYSYGFPFELEMIICGLNFYGEFKVFEIWEDGCLAEKSYGAVGSGTWDALYVLERRKKQINEGTLSEEEAISVAISAIYNSGEHDSGTSPVTAIVPALAKITSTGFEYIDEKTVRKIRHRVLRGERRND